MSTTMVTISRDRWDRVKNTAEITTYAMFYGGDGEMYTACEMMPIGLDCLRPGDLDPIEPAPPLSDVDREELARDLCETWGSESYCADPGHDGWMHRADALLATWRVVRRP